MTSNNIEITHKNRVDYKEALYTAWEIPDLPTEQIINDACLVLDNCNAKNLIKCSVYISTFRTELMKRRDVQSEGLNKLSDSLLNCLNALEASNKIEEAFVITRLDEWVKGRLITILDQGVVKHVEDYDTNSSSNDSNVVTSENSMEREENTDSRKTCVSSFISGDSDESNLIDKGVDSHYELDNYVNNNEISYQLTSAIESDHSSSTNRVKSGDVLPYTNTKSIIMSTDDIVKDTCTLLKGSNSFVELLPNWIKRSGSYYVQVIAQNMETLLACSDFTKLHYNMLLNAFEYANNVEFSCLNKGNTMLMQDLNRKVVSNNSNAANASTFSSDSNVVTSENDTESEENIDSFSIGNSDESNLEALIAIQGTPNLPQPEASGNAANANSSSNYSNVVTSENGIEAEENIDSSTIVYSFTIVNGDESNLDGFIVAIDEGVDSCYELDSYVNNNANNLSPSATVVDDSSTVDYGILGYAYSFIANLW